jgi:hypothetical protein
MKTYQYAVFPALAIAAFGFTAKPTSDIDDPIAASFERELNHESVVPAPAARADIDEDILYSLINKPLQTQPAAPTADVLVTRTEQ